MEITGKIIVVLPLQSGQGRNGEWKKQDYVIETQEQYPKKMSFNLWGDKIDSFGIKAGEMLTVSFDIDCREYNGRWYNDIRAWRVERQAPMAEGDANDGQPIPPPPAAMMPSDETDDLPF